MEGARTVQPGHADGDPLLAAQPVETGDQRGAEDAEDRELLGQEADAVATRQLADVAEVGKAKRRVAKIKTLIRERELLAEIDAAAASQNGN